MHWPGWKAQLLALQGRVQHLGELLGGRTEERQMCSVDIHLGWKRILGAASARVVRICSPVRCLSYLRGMTKGTPQLIGQLPYLRAGPDEG